MPAPRGPAHVPLVLVLLILGGCSPVPPEPGSLTVFAASSLQRAFTELGAQFSAENPGADAEFAFAGSADLVTQLTAGARADVLATADAATMDRAADSGVADRSAPLATNTLTIAVAPGNPLGVRRFADLTGVSVVACAPQVPCGAAVSTIEGSTGIDLVPVSEENSVADVLNKVRTGQADAGLVYRTDAYNAGDSVTAVDFPEAAQAVNVYRIAVTTAAADSLTAQRFVNFVTGPAGRAVLNRLGFGSP